jgi:hypothetical protein
MISLIFNLLPWQARYKASDRRKPVSKGHVAKFWRHLILEFCNTIPPESSRADRDDRLPFA